MKSKTTVVAFVENENTRVNEAEKHANTNAHSALLIPPPNFVFFSMILPANAHETRAARTVALLQNSAMLSLFITATETDASALCDNAEA